jgi:DnaK suppressor protein
MNPAELRALRRQITERIETLEILLGNSRQDDQESGPQPDDESARMDLTISSAVESRLTLAEKQELARLQANLQWLESNDAGNCEGCGYPIPFLRLKAVPVTRLCIQCAQNQS